RRDDRADPTTAADDNNTGIDLRGLHPARLALPYQQIIAGMSFKTSAGNFIHASARRLFARIVTDPDGIPESENENQPPMDATSFKAGFILARERVSFEFSGIFAQQKHSFSSDSALGKVSYTSSERGILFG